MAQRMQVARRKESIPWTWEPFVAGLALYLFVVLVAAQVGRGIAYLLAGDGFRWPTPDAQVSSAFAVLAGHSASGLLGTGVPVLGSTWLYICLIIVELVALTAVTWVGVSVFLRRGPARMLGMATRSEAEKLLGLARLRSHAAVIRPDLHQHPSNPSYSATPVEQISLDAGAADGIQAIVPRGVKALARDLAVLVLGRGRR